MTINTHNSDGKGLSVIETVTYWNGPRCVLLEVRRGHQKDTMMLTMGQVKFVYEHFGRALENAEESISYAL